jgi:H+/Cl- antiporter ClcA
MPREQRLADCDHPRARPHQGLAHGAPSARRDTPSDLASRPVVAIAAVTVAIGISVGLGGMAVGLLLHFIQHVAYGYGLESPLPAPTFLQGVSASSPARRVVVLTVCGLVAGIGWWALRGRGRPVVGIRRAVRPDGPPMPAPETLIDALLQLTTVALGSPLGRETAPRQVGAVLAGWLARGAGLSTDDVRRLIACGAGAGLAALYNVPLGGALYTLEVLLGTFSASAVVPALATSVIATRIAWIGLGNETPYEVPPFATGPSLVVWSIVAGPVLGVVAYAFARGVETARARAPRGALLVPWCLATFVVLGLVATRFPQILGNGRGPAQLGFGGQVTPGLAALLFVLKGLAVTATFRAGAGGGLLTPSLALGALLATVLGALWSLVWPEAPPSAFAVVGAAAFLATAQKMPITATVLALEFTRVTHDALFPILFAVSGAAVAGLACARWEASRPTLAASRE